MSKYRLRVASFDPTGRRILFSPWSNLCRHARKISAEQGNPVTDIIDELLLLANAENRPGDYLYFDTKEDKLMFVLRWS